MRVAVIDIGSNTARLLVAEHRGRGLERVGESKEYLGLGAEILLYGEIGAAKLAETAAATRRLAVAARGLGAAAIDVFVTAPGRQAENADELVAAVARATGHLVRVLSAAEEGELSYEGALATTAVGDGPVAVCDVGGGSTELTIGDPGTGALWSESVELGSLRLTAACLHADPPRRRELAAAERLVNEHLGPLDPPRVDTGLAVGGSARALARLVGGPLDERVLGEALAFAVARNSDKLARSAGLDVRRARTLAGGAIILRQVARLLGTPLRPAGGGLREGAAVRLLAARSAA